MQLRKNQQMKWSTFGLLVLLALLLSCGYRFVDLGMRPMHTDESILGIKFLDFWKTGVFDYDPHDYHGPFLHYLTRAFSWVMRWQDPESITEGRLRLVVAVTGVALVLVTLLLTDALGRRSTVLAMLMMATSPMMVFYSRYFIMELPFVLLLALFMIGCWRFSQGRGKLWLLISGMALGCVHATKETFVINLAAMFCGWIAARVLTEGFAKRDSRSLSFGAKKGDVTLPWAWVAVVAVVVSMALYSGGFKHWEDVQESVTTYASYVKRSGGAGGHEKPWHYYLGLMFWTKQNGLWTEAMIGVLALIGMLRAVFGDFGKETPRRAFLVFLTFYSLAALTAYSIIPYKTPWTILSVQWALTLLAGVGGAAFYEALRGRVYHWIVGLTLTAGLYHFCAQTKLAIYDPVAAQHQLFRANLSSPYVYSHTSENATKLVSWLQQLAALDPKGFSAQVINIDSGWPLPWYLRKISNVGYQIAMPDSLTAPVIVVDQTQLAAAQAKLAGRPYESDLFSLRPGVNVTLLVEKGLWDKLLASKAGAGDAKP